MSLEYVMEELEPVKEAIAIGQMELARNLLRILIEDYPDNASVWYHAAEAAVNDAQRKAFLEKAVTLDPLHHQAANELHGIQTGNIARPIAQPLRAEIRQAGIKAKPHYAHFGRRAIATILDMLLLTIVASPIISIVLGIVAPGVPPTFANLLSNTEVLLTTLLLTTLIQSLYYGYFLSRQRGQTPGKRLLGIRVIKRDGSELTIRDALLRNVIGYQISNLIPGIGFLWVFVDKQSRTWHDMMANTIVVNA